MYIPIILGTAREGRFSESVAIFMLEQAKKLGLRTELIDVRDYRMEATDNTQESEAAKRLSEKISEADAFVIVSPEYNHGYPGELKMMLDLLLNQYYKRPVGFCGVSMGFAGGARAVEQLKLVSIRLGMMPINGVLYFPKVRELFENGIIKDESFYARSEKFLKSLISYVK